MDRERYLPIITKEDRKLMTLFKEEMDRINFLYLQAVNAKDITKANQLFKKMKSISKTLEEDYWDRADIRIPTEYIKWASYMNAVSGIWTGVTVWTSLWKAEIKWLLKELWPIHIDAVNALLNNSKNYIKSSLDGMTRQAITMISELQQEKIREELAKSTISGESINVMNERVKKYFITNGINGFKDRGNKFRTMDRYVDMLTRTETAIANNQGVINRALQLWITKFRIVERPDCCKECAELDWEIVDLRDWPADLPPFHPNCRWYLVAVEDIFEEISPRTDEPWKTLNIPKDTYNYLKYDIEDVKLEKKWRYPIWLVNEAVIRNYTWTSHKWINNKKVDRRVIDRLEKIVKWNQNYSGIIYRWMALSVKEWEQYLAAGEIYEKGFTSTSKLKKRAKNFCNLRYTKETPIKVIFKLQAKGGMDIHRYSKIPNQKEILFSQWKTLKFDANSLELAEDYFILHWTIE